jgi:hypothetical protein
MRSANVFPEIDNTVTPLGYPLAIKFFTIFGLDEFWSSKAIGLLAFACILFFTWKKKFYFKESIILCSLFSFVSIFSYTMSETLILPFVFLYLWFGRNVIIGKYNFLYSILFLTLSLIALYNIRYSGLFFIGSCFVFGVWNWKKNYGKAFVISSVIGLAYVLFYKIFFIDYFNTTYIQQFLEMGLHPTKKLLVELFQGLTTSFNPFIHIANPAGGIINFGIYGLGLITIAIIIFIFMKFRLSETEKFFVFVSVFCIFSSYFIQYFYSVDGLDYRLLSPFLLPIWLVFFKKLYSFFGQKTYSIAFLSLMTGFVFTWLSKGDYLENRKNVKTYLQTENLTDKKIVIYTDIKENVPEQIQIVELISSVNPKIYISHNPKDTLQTNVLTAYKIGKKLKISKNKMQ